MPKSLKIEDVFLSPLVTAHSPPPPPPCPPRCSVREGHALGQSVPNARTRHLPTLTTPVSDWAVARREQVVTIFDKAAHPAPLYPPRHPATHPATPRGRSASREIMPTGAQQKKRGTKGRRLFCHPRTVTRHRRRAAASAASSRLLAASARITRGARFPGAAVGRLGCARHAGASPVKLSIAPTASPAAHSPVAQEAASSCRAHRHQGRWRRPPTPLRRRVELRERLTCIRARAQFAVTQPPGGDERQRGGRRAGPSEAAAEAPACRGARRRVSPADPPQAPAPPRDRAAAGAAAGPR